MTDAVFQHNLTLLLNAFESIEQILQGAQFLKNY